VDRRALPEPEWGKAEGGSEGPRTELEERIAEVWREVLGVERVGIHDNFFDLGGHSLNATKVVLELRNRLGIDLSIRHLFASPTVAELAATAAELGSSAREIEPIPRLPDRPAYPLSTAQKVMWLGFRDALQKATAGWGFPEVVRIEGPIDPERLRAALHALVARHEVLRSSFVEIDGEPGQVIHGEAEAGCPLHDLSSFAGDELQARVRGLIGEQAAATTDGRPPLLRVQLVRLEPRRHLLLMQVPHIVTDGWTERILAEDLAELYSALEEGRPASLAPLPARYVDFAGWVEGRLESPSLRAQRDYWVEQFREGPALLRLPRASRAADAKKLSFQHRTLRLEKDLVTAVRQLAAAHGTTLFVAMLAAFQALLARSTGTTDVAVGSPVAGRIHPALERVAGLFMNPLVLRCDLSGNPSFLELLGRVGDTVFRALANQECPLPVWVQELRRCRRRADVYLYSALLFVQEGATGLRFGEADATLESWQTYDVPLESVLDRAVMGRTLALYVSEGPASWRAELLDGLILDPTFLDGVLPQWTGILKQVVRRPGVHLQDLEVPREADEARRFETVELEPGELANLIG
jgi:acyl carrier protein